MQNIILDNLSLIILLPLWIFLIIMGGRFFSVYVNKKIIFILTLLSSFLGILGTSFSLVYLKEGLEYSIPFIQINDFVINCGINVDKLSLILSLTLFTVSFIVQIFAISYMKEEKKNYRFFALLNLFNFFISALFFSPNLFQMYVFWELAGIVSYLLIGFEYNKNEKSLASKRVFLINRFGDTALIAGIILTSYFMYNYAGNVRFATLSFDDMNAISTILAGYTEPIWFVGICLLFIVAAIVKSAQFPFQTWLCDAMEAKLPVSALLHSATIVASGFYLVIRLLPFFTLDERLMQIIALAGFVTLIICSVFASFETNNKKILAYSTSANFGLLFMLLGLENVLLGIIYFIIHALVKSMLFIILPSEEKENSVLNYSIFILGALTLSGLLLSGFAGKEIIYECLGGVFKPLFLISVFITAYYLTRLALLTKPAKWNSQKISIPAMLLIILNFGFYILLKAKFNYKVGFPFFISIFGILTAYILYRFNFIEKIKLTKNILENIIIQSYCYISETCNKFEQRVLYNYRPMTKTIKNLVIMSSWAEENIMNKTVRIISEGLKRLSAQYKILQSGNIQNYNSYALIFITVIVTLIIISYRLILNQMS